ncbi:MAG: hypothetical protein AB7C96_12215 [Hydrogenovibrio sp.]
MRDKSVLIAMELNGQLCIHFCDYGLSGLNMVKGEVTGREIWFPIMERSNLFLEVERILVANKVAHNLVALDILRKCGESIDYRFEFNVFKS